MSIGELNGMASPLITTNLGYLEEMVGTERTFWLPWTCGKRERDLNPG